MSSQALLVIQSKWVRSKDGYIAGVCEGLGRSFGIEPWWIRIFWLLSLFAFGTGILLYAILAFSLPREDKLAEAASSKILGVCSRIARRSGFEVGAVRALAVLFALISFGLTFIIYLGLYFAGPKGEDVMSASRGNELVPPQ